MFQLLPPRVQHHQHPDPRSQVFGVGRHFQKSLLGAVKEHSIQELTVAQDQRLSSWGKVKTTWK